MVSGLHRQREKVCLYRESFLSFLLFSGIVLFSIVSPSYAVHKGAGDLTCGNCHTMHNSQGNASMEGVAGGSILLLRGQVTSRAEIHKLCLQCHGVGGSMWTNTFPPHGQRAPIVYGGSLLNWDHTKDFSQMGAGGDFFKELDSNFALTFAGSQNALGYGHSVGLANAAPPGFPWGSPFSNDFNCTTCHDPHGVGIASTTIGGTTYDNFVISRGIGINTYRNLKLFAVFFPPYWGILSESKSWVGGITGKYGAMGANYVPQEVNGVAIWPVYINDPTLPENNNVYDGIGLEGMSGFCSQCHSLWHEKRAPDYGDNNINGEDWLRHPVDAVISNSDISGSGTDTIDWSHYSSTPDGYKLPAANTGSDLSQEFYYADSDNEDKVFCLSCHFAHGGPYYDALRWDYVASIGSGTQQGKGVPSNKGCQQCHNR